MHAWLPKGLFILVTAAALTGCVNNGAVLTKQPLTAPLAAEKGWVVATSDVPDGKAYLDKIKLEMDRALRDEGVVGATAEGGLTVDVKVVGLSTGDKLARYMNSGGEAEITLEVSITDAGGKSLTQLTVVGNSTRQSETRVGGVKLSANDNLVARAISAAVDQLVDYLTDPPPPEDG